MNRRALALWGIVLLGLFGASVGGLMTWHHEVQLYAPDAQQGQLIGCEESASVNCDIVNTSAWSEILRVPLGTWAIAFYLTVGSLGALGLRRGKDAPIGLPLVLAGLGAVGFSAFLYHISTSELGYVCAWCLRLYLTNGALLALALTAGGPWSFEPRVFGRGLAVGLVLLVLTVAGQRGFRYSLTGGADVTISREARSLDHDPKGSAPALSIPVTTEDKKQATFTLDADDAWSGNPKAGVTVVMFGDFECGYCKRSSAELGRLYATYSDKVLFVFKHFPMDPACNPGVKNKKHRSACLAAKAAVCAQNQGYFWAFHDLAYKNQHRLDSAALRTYAVDVGANGNTFDACMTSPDADAVVRHDAETGASVDIHGTPRIFINGTLYRSGTSAEMMAQAIEKALGTPPEESAQRVGALKDVEPAVTAIPADVPLQRALSFGNLNVRIDTFEATIKDKKAIVGKHEIPALRTTWYEAKAACEAAGRRLCTEEEWVSACQNARATDDNQNGEFGDDMIEGTAYPYGDYHEDGRCWDAHEDAPDGTAYRPVYTGEMPGCVTPTGVYDMTGNVEEWVGDSPEHAALMGGAWDTTEDHARCYRRNDTFGPGYATPRTGFRCCSG